MHGAKIEKNVETFVQKFRAVAATDGRQLSPSEVSVAKDRVLDGPGGRGHEVEEASRLREVSQRAGEQQTVRSSLLGSDLVLGPTLLRTGYLRQLL
uniref:Uncharacterized protein n=1 Tax=Trichogramma kaykai TaxID=54128 RepID=A0ABD2X7L0_9HYME